VCNAVGHLCTLGPSAWVAASVQQTPAKRLPVPELAERGSTKALSALPPVGRPERLEALGTSQVMAWQPSACALPVASCSSPASWQRWQQEGATCPQDLGPQPLLQERKKKKIGDRGRVPPLVTKDLRLAKPPSSYL
jgi:hypothetical protein